MCRCANMHMRSLPDGVIGNTQEFESCVFCSNQSPVTEQDVVFSLFGKASHCECEEQGSIPGDNRKNIEQGTEEH